VPFLHVFNTTTFYRYADRVTLYYCDIKKAWVYYWDKDPLILNAPAVIAVIYHPECAAIPAMP
jgi:hypothetical protein